MLTMFIMHLFFSWSKLSSRTVLSLSYGIVAGTSTTYWTIPVKSISSVDMSASRSSSRSRKVINWVKSSSDSCPIQ
jgi:hypothetical protein